MRNILCFLLTLWVIQPAMGASFPAQQQIAPVYEKVTPSADVIVQKENRKINKANKVTLLQKAKMKLLQFCQTKGLLVEGEMTPKQKRQAKWSLILGLGSIVLLVIPYAGLLAIPAAITGLILGIKSIEGNSNTNGIIGIIASGLTLLLLLVAIVLVATLLANWN